MTIKRIYTAGMALFFSIYGLGLFGIILNAGMAFSEGGTTTTSAGADMTTTTVSSPQSIPWEDLRKSVSETAVITLFAFMVISALIGLVLYFARSKSADAIRHEGIVSDMQKILIDCVTKNTIALDKLISKLDDEHDLLKTHPCILLDSKHRNAVLKVIDETEEKQ